jgi:hypothetical protein
LLDRSEAGKDRGRQGSAPPRRGCVQAPMAAVPAAPPRSAVGPRGSGCRRRACRGCAIPPRKNAKP